MKLTFQQVNPRGQQPHWLIRVESDRTKDKHYTIGKIVPFLGTSLRLPHKPQDGYSLYLSSPVSVDELRQIVAFMRGQEMPV